VLAENTSPGGQLSPEQRARLEVLLPQAQQVLQSIEDRMVALTIAATARWQPEQDVLDTDEGSAPVFGDDEFDTFLSMVEELAEHAWFQEISKFLNLPDNVVHQVMVDSLKARFVETSATALKKSNVPFVVHRRHNIPGGR